MFARGLHFPGVVTPTHVSLMCVCDVCAASFRLQPFHAGFSQLTYFYCSSGLHTLAVDAHEDGAPVPLTVQAEPGVCPLEERLPPCGECGGRFEYLNPLACPTCGQPFIDFRRFPEIRTNEYYGNVHFGGRLQRWP